MAPSDRSSSRLRSATEFPKNVEGLQHSEASQLYGEMRDCLIFTNRSRAQLLRRNEEHKKSALQLKTDVERLQVLLDRLKLEKQDLIQTNQSTVSELEREFDSMASHLNQLSTAFDAVADIETLQQTQWSFVSLPNRFFGLLRAVKAIVSSWREEHPEEGEGAPQLPSSPPGPPSITGTEEDQKERPQLYTDQASVNRFLLDR